MVVIVVVVVVVLVVVVIMTLTMIMVLSSWHSRCESSGASFDGFKTAPSGRQPSDQATHVGPRVRVCAANIHTHHRCLLLLLGLKAGTQLLSYGSVQM